ncbi:hypothetical protein CB1_001473001 [Camelus ferus]|nr:hypothetical protein CB1_001473001 [Camelus ferus]
MHLPSTGSKLQLRSLELEQRDWTLFEVRGYLTQSPCWLHSEHLMASKAVRLKAWLVEAILGRGGARIPHIQRMSQTVLHVSKWDPEGEAELLMLARPYHQKDASKNLEEQSDLVPLTPFVEKIYGTQVWPHSALPGDEKAPAREAVTQWSPGAAHEVATHGI